MHRSEGVNPAQSPDIKNFKSAAILISPIMTALLIISALTLAGKMSGIVAGSSIVGLSAAVLLIQVVLACRNKTPSLKIAPLGMSILPVVSIILGSLTFSGTLPLSTVAWTVCGTSAGVGALAVLGLLGYGCIAVSKIRLNGRSGKEIFGSSYQSEFNDIREDEWNSGEVTGPPLDPKGALADWEAHQKEEHT